MQLKSNTKRKQLIDEHDTSNADVNEMARQNTEIVQKAAEEILGRVTSNRCKNWFDDECKIAVEERKVTYSAAKTRSKVLTYNQKKIPVYRLFRRKKREFLNQEIENLESQNRNGNVRDFYEITKNQ